MNIKDSLHAERFEEMKKDVDPSRQSEWFFYRGSESHLGEEMADIFSQLQKQFVNVGPFGYHFTVTTAGVFKDEFYGIPFQYRFTESVGFPNCFAFVATNDHASVQLKTIFDFFFADSSLKEIEQLQMSAICVHTAIDQNKESIVYSVECIEGLMPMAYYAHPANGRFINAISGIVEPDHAALTMVGKRREANAHIGETLLKMTSAYKSYGWGHIDQNELSQVLYGLFYKE